MDKRELHPDLMDMEEMVKYTGLSKSTLYKQIKAETLPARKTGRGFVALRTNVEKFRSEYYGR